MRRSLAQGGCWAGVAEAVAVAGGRITCVSSDAGAGAHIGTGTDVVELRGRTLMPGIHDGHLHPLSGGPSLTRPILNHRKLDLRESVAAIRKLLARGADQEPVRQRHRPRLQGDSAADDR